MQLEATSRPADDYNAEAHRWTVEAELYDDAFEQIRNTIPPGHMLLHVRRLYDD